MFLFITAVSFFLSSFFHTFHSLSPSVLGHQTLPVFPSWGNSTEPSHSPQCDIYPCTFTSFLQMFSFTWVNPQFIPSLLPSISSHWVHVGPMHSTVLEDWCSCTFHHNWRQSHGLLSPCLTILGQESRKKLYAGSCPIECLHICVWFWPKAALDQK